MRGSDQQTQAFWTQSATPAGDGHQAGGIGHSPRSKGRGAQVVETRGPCASQGRSLAQSARSTPRDCQTCGQPCIIDAEVDGHCCCFTTVALKGHFPRAIRPQLAILAVVKLLDSTRGAADG